jgi:sugar lactone lactonase YvrE
MTGSTTMKTRTLLDGLAFPEGPRWRDGRLYFSDMHNDRVMAVGLDGKAEEIVAVPGSPSGLGWLPDGRMLVVSMTDRRLLCHENDGTLREVADLRALSTYHCNDMVVDEHGRAYVGNFGFDLHGGGERQPSNLVLVTLEGDTRVVAEALEFPNGTVITPDGRTLIIGETMAARLTAFDIAEDGSLSNRREWAKLEKALPDGICLDAEGAIWVASPVGHKVLRVEPGGHVTHRVEIESQAFACMLGGPERRTLFVCTAEDSHPDHCRKHATACIEMVEVDVPGAGLP